MNKIIHEFRVAFKSIDINPKLPNSNEDLLLSRQTPKRGKAENSKEDFNNNNTSTGHKKENHSLELETSIQKQNGNKGNVPSDQNMVNNNIKLLDSPDGAALLKTTPLKGLSSSIKPRLFKSIGIQVDPEKW